jgi:Holliday junction resolvasome RuvABC endonuclease subunit
VCVGWALFEEGQLISYGKFHPQGRERFHGPRLESFRQWLEQILAETHPTFVVVEAPYRGRNGKTYGILSMYLGMVLAVHYAHFGRELDRTCAVQPKQIKHILRLPIRRQYRDRKRQAVDWANRVYGLNLRFKDNDARAQINDADTADAIAVATAWILGSAREA